MSTPSNITERYTGRGRRRAKRRDLDGISAPKGRFGGGGDRELYKKRDINQISEPT